MIAPALRKIAMALRQLAEDAEQPDFRVEPFDLRTLARQVEAQQEMVEQEIAE